MHAQPVRPASFGLADLYPEAKGPMPSTSQLGNPHEVAAAIEQAGRVLTAPPLNARLVSSPLFWFGLVVAALFVLGMRK
jgi:hypothetical protein